MNIDISCFVLAQLLMNSGKLYAMNCCKVSIFVNIDFSKNSS